MVADLHIIHIDMDAFFAAIEQRDEPSLQGKPVIVGGRPQSRGVVSTASYEARKYGIHSGMPTREALRLCPFSVFLPVNMVKYKEVSNQLRRIFSRYTNQIEPLSVDEAFLGIDDGNTLQLGREMKHTIKEELKLTASVGISFNKFLAKLASDMEKPDGFTVITREKAKLILPELPVRRLWGIGPKTETDLHQVGLYTFSDVVKADMMLLTKVLGKRAGEIRLLAEGIDDRKIQVEQQAKSFGEETTLARDTDSKEVLLQHLADFSDMLANRLQAAKVKARTVTVKIRYDDFTDMSRSKTSQEAYESSRAILDTAVGLFAKLNTEGRRVRLVGLQVSGFLFPDQPEQMQFTFDHES
jgi:DNA polymerase IV